jgi:DNA-directed RNA polymerase specialized sigma24 family protein
VTDRDLVTALRAGDRLAAGQVYDIYGTRLYAYCHELLGDHKLAGDALRDTFVVAVARVRELRRPDELGAWLYAIARGEGVRAGVSEEIPHDAGDAARGDRLARLALDCYAMLAPETREVLDLAFRHRLVDTDLARVLGASETDAAELVASAQSDLENMLLVVLAARTGDPKCHEAAELGRRFDQLDGRDVDGWLQSAGRHVAKCVICTGTVKARRPLRLFEELPHSFMPPGVRSRVLETLRDPAGAAFATKIAERAGKFDDDGFPVSSGRGGPSSGRKWVLPLGLAAAVAAIGVVGYVVMANRAPGPSTLANSSLRTSTSAASSQSPGDLVSISASDSTSASPSASASSALSTSAAPIPTTPSAPPTTPRIKVCSTVTATVTVQVPVQVTVSVTVTYTPTPTASSTPTTTVSPTVTTSLSPSPSPTPSVSCTMR